MIDFISENFILCITAVYVFLGMIMSIKLKNSDMKIVEAKSFKDMLNSSLTSTLSRSVITNSA